MNPQIHRRPGQRTSSVPPPWQGLHPKDRSSRAHGPEKCRGPASGTSLKNQRTRGPSSVKPCGLPTRALTPTTAPRREHGPEPRQPHLGSAAVGPQVAGASDQLCGEGAQLHCKTPAPFQAPLTTMTAQSGIPHTPAQGAPSPGSGTPPPTQALPLCVNASSPFRRHGRDHNTCSSALRRDLSHGAGQHLVSVSGLRMKAVGGAGWSSSPSSPSDAKSHLSRCWRQRCDPSRPWRQPPAWPRAPAV